MSFEPYTLLAGFIFGMVGLGAFRYGRKLELWKPTVIGLVLMVYPYFIYNKWAVWIIGAALIVLLWFQHDE